jgi:hypothetical protein
MFMKRRSSFLGATFALLITLSGCGTTIQSEQASGSALVKIECNNASLQEILHMLRAGRGKDISVTADVYTSEITAAFSVADTPPKRLQQILQDLDQMGGVLHTEVVENPRPIKQTF